MNCPDPNETAGPDFLLDVRETVRKLAARVDQCIAEFLPRQLNEDRLEYFAGAARWRYDTALATAGLSRPVWDLLDRKGKRWRPIFGILLLEALGTPSLPYEELLCLTAELLHTGSLIIDDIEDRSLLRRGGECIHLRHGESVAINSANTLYFLPLLCLFEHPQLSECQRSQICQIIIRQIIRTHIGQGFDIQWSSHLSRGNLENWLADGLQEKILEILS